jgi:hypothetical protein
LISFLKFSSGIAICWWICSLLIYEAITKVNIDDGDGIQWESERSLACRLTSEIKYHVIFRKKNERYWHIFTNCQRTFARFRVFSLRSSLHKSCATFKKVKEVGSLWEFAKVAQKGNSTMLDTALADYQRRKTLFHCSQGRGPF